MKHAFIFGTTIFLSTQRTLTVNDDDKNTEFLRILSFYNERKNNESLVLNIDANISTMDGRPLSIVSNTVADRPDIRLVITKSRIKVYQTGHEEPVIDVYQFDEHEYAGLSSHILNEIHSQRPDRVLTIKGNFKVGDTHFLIENEKMFVDTNGYANGVVNAHHGIILSPANHDFN
jgi:hypothetical protein